MKNDRQKEAYMKRDYINEKRPIYVKSDPYTRKETYMNEKKPICI